MNRNLIKLIYLYPTIFWFWSRGFEEFFYLRDFALGLYKKIDLSKLSEEELRELVEILKCYAKFIPEFQNAYERVSIFLKVTEDVAKSFGSNTNDDNKDDDVFDDTNSVKFKP